MTTPDSPTEIDCPQCGRKVCWSDDYPYRPFCSRRCQMLDFGDWANENHRIAGDPALDSMSSEDEDSFQGQG